jgi:hypothetical protein
MRRAAAVLACVLGAASAGAAAPETKVDVALVLAVDVSGSMDADEQFVQRQGYVAAFRDPEIVRAIRSGLNGRIAVTYMEWSDAQSQSVTVPWRVLVSDADAVAFAAELAAAPISTGQRTSISAALLFAANLLDQAGVDAAARTIDISGDGANNDGRPLASARRVIAGRGITINGLPITIRPTTYFFGPPFGPFTLDGYYRECVIMGPGAFAITVESPDGFHAAIRRKLVLEIAGTNPGTALADVILAAARAPQAPPVDCLIGERAGR